jgi:hypothetical protein
VLPAIQTSEDSRNDRAFELRSITVGFGVKAQAGIGPFFLGIKPEISAGFVRGEHPPVP